MLFTLYWVGHQFRGTQNRSSSLTLATAGWLVWFLAGFLHRDISIGNVLALCEPAKRQKFEVPALDELYTHFSLLREEAPRGEHPADQKEGAEVYGSLWRDVADERDRLAKVVEDLGRFAPLEECHAILTDGDGAADMRTDHFAGNHAGTLLVSMRCFGADPHEI